MVLKEAFRYQNFLDRMATKCQCDMCDSGMALSTKRIHHKQKANPEAEDLEETVKPEKEYEISQVIRLADELTKEKMATAKAVSMIKAKCITEQGFDLDASLEAAKYMRDFADNIHATLGHKASAHTQKGTDYKFNAEGNQVPYVYDIDIEITERFDRKALVARKKDILKQADLLSSQIEKFQLETETEFEPKFSIHDSYEDLLAQA